MIFNYLLLPAFFFIGAITSYEDFRYGKIRNKWIILGAAWGLGVYLFFFIWYFAGPPLAQFYYANIINLPPDAPHPVFVVHLSFLSKSLINGLAALFVGFLIWRAQKWSAGDAKLFFVFSLLIPATYYWKSYLPIFPSFVLLVNIFVPLLLFLFLKSCFHFFGFFYSNFNKFKIAALFKRKEGPGGSWKNRLVMFLGFLGIFAFFNLFREQAQEYFSVNLASFQMIIFPLLVIFGSSIAKLFRKPLAVKVIFIVLGLFFAYGFIFSLDLTLKTLLDSAKMMIVFMIVFALFNKLINFYVESGIEEGGKRVFPLAVWIFGGAILTLILKGSILSLFLQFLR